MRLARRLALAAAGAALTGGAVTVGPTAALPAGAASAAVHAALASRVTPTAHVAPAGRAPAPGGIQAQGAALENAATGALLWSRGLDTRRPIASITKVMTALVVLRAGQLGRVLTVPASAVSYVRAHDGSTAGLRAGDQLTVRLLLEALLVPSGCDAAYVLASAYGPGQTAFVAKMNALAAQMKLGRTHFADAGGLPVPTEYSTYSTPGDVLAIGRAAMTDPVFRALVGQSVYRVAAGPGHHAYIWHNDNMLLTAYPGVIGIKTGSTAAAGYCLLFAAQRGQVALIGVVLDSSSVARGVSFSDTEQLLTWGFG